MLGLARSGEAAALALARRGVGVLGVDRKDDLDAGRLRAAGVEVVLGAEDPALLEGVDLLVKSP
ncbi:MAG: UDP-N-acetylmuramoyl-L-alanine--D-glutamate ligase, partial [Gaiellaceae bacterium]